MYFPILRGKQNELLALRDLAPRIVASGNIIPIIEPTKANASTRVSFIRYVESNLRFILIVNPEVGDLAGGDEVYVNLVQQCLDDYDNFIPAYYIGGATNQNQVQQFLNRYAPRVAEVAFIFNAEPSANLAAFLRAVPNCRYHIFVENRTSQQLRSGFTADITVLINDVFHKAERNADYPADEFFSDRHLQAANAGFGDYSIVGSDYSEQGGPAYAVTLHHVYYTSGRASPLHIRHFISDRTDTAVDPAGKFLEALAKLVQALPQLDPANRTPTCDDYAHLYAIQDYPGLGFAKKLAIKHHLELFLV